MKMLPASRIQIRVYHKYSESSSFFKSIFFNLYRYLNSLLHPYFTLAFPWCYGFCIAYPDFSMKDIY